VAWADVGSEVEMKLARKERDVGSRTHPKRSIISKVKLVVREAEASMNTINTIMTKMAAEVKVVAYFNLPL
jgi:hypothetical protein